MNTEKIDYYAAIIADAEAKKAALEAIIASVKNAMALGALGQPGELPVSMPSNTNHIPIDLPVGAFSRKSVPAAVKLYLAAVKVKKSTPQISIALKDGGMETTASNFETVVAGALHRLKLAGEVLRFEDGWGLTENYPEHIRKALSEEQKPNRNKPKKKAKAKDKVRTDRSSKAASVVVPINKGVGQQIANLLSSGKSLHPTDIAKTLELNATGVNLTLGRMAAKHMVEKCEGGKYRALIQKAV